MTERVGLKGRVEADETERGEGDEAVERGEDEREGDETRRGIREGEGTNGDLGETGARRTGVVTGGEVATDGMEEETEGKGEGDDSTEGDAGLTASTCSASAAAASVASWRAAAKAIVRDQISAKEMAYQSDQACSIVSSVLASWSAA